MFLSVSSRFFIVSGNCAGTCFPTGSGAPKACHGPQLGDKNLPKEVNLEEQSAPKTSTWRSRALPRTEIGGPERSKNSTWGPKRRKELYLELQSPSESPIWRAKALRDPNLEAQRASKMQTKAFAEPNLPMIRATRSRSIDREDLIIWRSLCIGKTL